jgi:glycerophosphoryl diester phosphodiesterase
VDFGYTNPTKNGTLDGERVKFTTAEGENVTPLDVKYPEGVAPRDSEIFFATTLEELLTAFPNNIVNVEIKQDGELGIRCLDAIIELLEKYDAFGRVVLASFHDGIYDEFCRRKSAGELPESFMYSPGIGGVVKYYLLTITGLDVFFKDGIAVLQLPTSEFGIKLATKRIVKNAHEHNVAVHYWTVNDKEEMRELIGIGADGIMTDYPHRLAEVYAEYTD